VNIKTDSCLPSCLSSIYIFFFFKSRNSIIKRRNAFLPVLRLITWKLFCSSPTSVIINVKNWYKEKTTNRFAYLWCIFIYDWFMEKITRKWKLRFELFDTKSQMKETRPLFYYCFYLSAPSYRIYHNLFHQRINSMINSQWMRNDVPRTTS